MTRRSWNCFGAGVSDELMRVAIDALPWPAAVMSQSWGEVIDSIGFLSREGALLAFGEHRGGCARPISAVQRDLRLPKTKHTCEHADAHPNENPHVLFAKRLITVYYASNMYLKKK